MRAAIALGERGRGRTAPNPNVGCVIVGEGRVVGRGWTSPGGRPHAEAIALEQAGQAARGATAFVTLEPCAHQSAKGPTCSDSLIHAGVARLVCAVRDADPRTDGKGFARLRDAGIAVETGLCADEAERSMAGYLSRMRRGRPLVTLKLALSLDGCIALANGESRWITGAESRAHVHIERASADMILVGRGTYETDAPRLDVRIDGMEDRSPARALLTRRAAPDGWTRLRAPEEVAGLAGINDLFVEGGAETAASFLRADFVDRLLLYRAPILVGGGGKAAIGDLGLTSLADAHGRWTLHDRRALGSDLLEVYERNR